MNIGNSRLSDSDRSILPERKSLRLSFSLTNLHYYYRPGDSDPTYRLTYRVDILNTGKMSVKLLARKWSTVYENEQLHITEVENIFNTQPILPPNGVFSYGGMQLFNTRPIASELRIAGIDQLLTPFISVSCPFSPKQLTPRSSYR